MRYLKQHISGLIFVVLCASIAGASAIKTFTTETLTANDLNTVLQHLHANLGHGHGAIVVNADISTIAAITHSKMATPALIPKAWAYVSATCDGAAAAGTACTLTGSSQVTSITSNGTAGQYRINLAYTPSNVNFVVTPSSGTATIYCTFSTLATTTPNALVVCKTNADVATNTPFNVVVMDD